MEMHGEYFREMHDKPNIDVGKSVQWLEQSHLRFETESLLCAAQEQTLATKYMTSKIWGTGKCTKCRLCKEQDETVHHIASGCKMLLATKYKFRHDQIGKYVHWCILKDRRANVSKTWNLHTPDETTIIGKDMIMWDVPITTDKKLEAIDRT